MAVNRLHFHALQNVSGKNRVPFPLLCGNETRKERSRKNSNNASLKLRRLPSGEFENLYPPILATSVSTIWVSRNFSVARCTCIGRRHHVINTFVSAGETWNTQPRYALFKQIKEHHPQTAYTMYTFLVFTNPQIAYTKYTFLVFAAYTKTNAYTKTPA